MIFAGAPTLSEVSLHGAIGHAEVFTLGQAIVIAELPFPDDYARIESDPATGVSVTSKPKTMVVELLGVSSGPVFLTLFAVEMAVATPDGPAGCSVVAASVLDRTDAVESATLAMALWHVAGPDDGFVFPLNYGFGPNFIRPFDHDDYPNIGDPMDTDIPGQLPVPGFGEYVWTESTRACFNAFASDVLAAYSNRLSRLTECSLLNEQSAILGGVGAGAGVLVTAGLVLGGIVCPPAGLAALGGVLALGGAAGGVAGGVIGAPLGYQQCIMEAERKYRIERDLALKIYYDCLEHNGVDLPGY